MQVFFATQLQRDVSSPIHLKDDVGQNKNKNNNKHKRNTINWEKYLFMSVSIWLLWVERTNDIMNPQQHLNIHL
jgi:hypothetical protein